MVAILLLTLAGAIRRRGRLPRKVFLSFLVALLPMTAALVANLFVDAVPIFDGGGTVVKVTVPQRG